MQGVARDDRSTEMWFGNVHGDGLNINTQSPRPELIIEAARTLEQSGE